MDNKTVLIIAPHHDDEIIGCGGTLLALTEQGYEVFVQHVFEGSSGILNTKGKQSVDLRTLEAEQAAKIGGYKVLPNLGFKDRTENQITPISLKLIDTFRKVRPTIVFVPHDDEQDFEHQVVTKAGWEAQWLATTTNFLKPDQKPSTSVALYLGYEVWRPIAVTGTYFDITRFVEKKKELLAAFESQMNLTSWIDGSLGLNAYRGTMLQGHGYAEAFTVRNISSGTLEKLIKAL